MNVKNQRKIGVVLSYVSLIISTVVQLLYTPLLIRKLGQSEYGLYSLVSSIIGYLTVLDLGFGNAIIVYTAKYRAKNEVEKEKKMLGMFKIIFYIVGSIIAFIGVVLYLNVDNMFGKTMTPVELSKIKTMMLILCFNLIVTFVFNIYSAIINAYENFVFQKLMSIMNTLLKPIIMIPLLFFGYKSITMCLVITTVNIIVVVSNYLYCKQKLHVKVKYHGFDKKLFWEMFSYSFFIFLNSIVDKANWSVDQFILGTVSGTIAVSLYSIASQLNRLFVDLSTALTGVLLPKMSKMIAQKVDSEELTNEMIKVGRIQFYIVFLMLTGFILIGKEFINIWAGDVYNESYYIALVLIVPVCVPLIQSLGLSIIQAMNRYRFKAIITSIMAIVNVFISFILAKKYGPIGSAIGTAVALIVCNIFMMNIYYYKVVKLNIIKFWKQILYMICIMIIPFTIMLVLKYIVGMHTIIGIVLYGGGYTILYFCIAYYVAMNDYEKNIVNGIFREICRNNKIKR